MIFCHWDQTNRDTVACICLLAAQAQLMAVPLIHLQLMVVHRTVLSSHITLKSMVHLFPCVSRHTVTDEFLGMPCDTNGNYLDPSMPPPPHHPTDDPDDWTPYGSRLEFETAEFIFSRNQMLAGDIDILLDLWSASLFKHGDQPPFASHQELYDTIDSTPLGDVPWESFSVHYNGIRPENDVPSWMDAEYDVWFRNPHTLVQNILSNPDFDNEFDYTPLQEHDMDGNHRFENFMSGNWAWKQAVSQNLLLY